MLAPHNPLLPEKLAHRDRRHVLSSDAVEQLSRGAGIELGAVSVVERDIPSRCGLGEFVAGPDAINLPNPCERVEPDFGGICHRMRRKLDSGMVDFDIEHGLVEDGVIGGRPGSMHEIQDTGQRLKKRRRIADVCIGDAMNRGSFFRNRYAWVDERTPFGDAFAFVESGNANLDDSGIVFREACRLCIEESYIMFPPVVVEGRHLSLADHLDAHDAEPAGDAETRAMKNVENLDCCCERAVPVDGIPLC